MECLRGVLIHNCLTHLNHSLLQAIKSLFLFSHVKGTQKSASGLIWMSSVPHCLLFCAALGVGDSGEIKLFSHTGMCDTLSAWKSY